MECFDVRYLGGNVDGWLWGLRAPAASRGLEDSSQEERAAGGAQPSGCRLKVGA